MIASLRTKLELPREAAPLAVFRIFFGGMMFFSLIRFWYNGWIESLYLEPDFHFSYYGFEWVKPLGSFTYVIFVACALASIGIALGYKYRWSCILFFLSFTYIELMDKTTYLNHYYFISVLSLLMIFLPLQAYYSLDACKHPEKGYQKVPGWTVLSLRLLIGIVYFYAGLAKLNSDWLLEAMPLKIWLPSKFDLPLIGSLLGREWVQYAFSWAGALFDLSVPFLLLFRKTRIPAFVVLVIFHVLTRVLFPIGMFPYIMIVSVLIFFPPGLHHRILQFISRIFGIIKSRFDNGRTLSFGKGPVYTLRNTFLLVFFGVQLLFPWRYLLYPGELFWTEEGYRFSWRVMLMEKSGYAQFKVVDKDSGKWVYVDNAQFLTPFQEKQMSFQPDFILEFAHFLESHYRQLGWGEVSVYVDSRVALNGRLSQPFIDPEADLTQYEDTFEHKTWILPFHDTIKGL